MRVDGNDPLAVYAATADALAAMPEEGATLIEAVTYRMGFHTSSDNPDLYRRDDEVEAWSRWDPIDRTRKYPGAPGMVERRPRGGASRTRR